MSDSLDNSEGEASGAEQLSPASVELSLNSARHWLPRISAEPLLSPNLPRTEVVLYDHVTLRGILDGEKLGAAWSTLVDQVAQAARRIGWPVFIRTDLASAKHGGPESYLARSQADVAGVLYRTVEDNELKFWLSPDQPSAFLIRQHLTLEAPFRAFAGLPIAREWRFYVNAESVLCAHPYWPEASIRFRRGCVEPPNWKEHLRELHEQPDGKEWAQLSRLAQTAAAAADPYQVWSVDFAKACDGNWWLIDMALMQNSWHWPGCPRNTNAGERET